MSNEFNLGLGVNYTIHQDERGVWFGEAGLYQDSGSHTAKIAGTGYQFKVGESWRLGAALLGVQSQTYNRGRAFIAPVPIVSYDFGPVQLNAIYFPKFRDYNKFAVFGFYFTLPLAK